MSKSTGRRLPGYVTGRPSDYRAEYCDLLIKHMSEGLSFESFGAIANCCKDTLYGWAAQFPEFLDAKRTGLEKSRIFWEKMGIHGTTGNLKTVSKEITKPNGDIEKRYKTAYFNAQSWNMNMKNRFGWKDRVEVDNTSSDGSSKPQVNIYIPKNGREQI